MPVDISQILTMLGAQVAQQVQTTHPQADNYVHALGRLMGHASRWQAVGQTGIVCATRFRSPIGERVSCGESAIGGCVVCRQPLCLTHAMVSPRDGTAVCFGCVGDAQRAAGHAPPPNGAPGWGSSQGAAQGNRSDDADMRLRSQHLDTLGLRERPTTAEIHAAYKSLAFENHPDRARKSEKKAASSRLAGINAAYEWLLRDIEGRAA